MHSFIIIYTIYCTFLIVFVTIALIHDMIEVDVYFYSKYRPFQAPPKLFWHLG